MEYFFPPAKQADDHTKRVMLRKALRAALTVIMKHHVYTFDSEIRKQKRGGPIGVKLTGVLAQIFMLWWDEELTSRLNAFKIHQKMSERYVDDINIAAQPTRPGLKFRDGQVVMDDTQVEEDRKVAPDERTMELIKEIGDDIHPSIKLEVGLSIESSRREAAYFGSKVWVECRKKAVEQGSSGDNV